MSLSARHDAPAPTLRLPGMALGRIVLLAGVVLTFFGMSQPFYMVKIPVGLLSQMGQMFADPAMQQYANAAARQAYAVNARGGTEVSAWTAFDRIDLAIAALCIAAVAVVLLRAAGHLSSAVARRVWLCGALAAALVAYRIYSPPVPDGASSYVTTGQGAWITLAGAAVVMVGGWLSVTQDPN